jgi:outer membrane protein assembly factor BamB
MQQPQQHCGHEDHQRQQAEDSPHPSKHQFIVSLASLHPKGKDHLVPPRFILSLLCLLPCALCPAADWPGHLGPHHDGTSPESLHIDPAAPWPVLWKKEVGQGFAAPAIVGDKLILFHRIDEKEIVECLNAKTGDSIWTSSYPATFQCDYTEDEGPRATPTIAQDRVYTFGADGILGCRALADGKVLWSINVKSILHADKGFFGFSSSPLIEGKALVLNLGGKSAGMAAFDINSGKLLWSVLDDEPGCSSPILFPHAGQRYIASLTGAALNLLDPTNGHTIARHPFRTRKQASVNAMTPLVVDDQIFIAAAYGSGAAVLRFDGQQLTPLWSSDDALSCHYNTPVYHNGYLFGFHGKQNTGPDLRCIEWKTGKVMWTAEGVGHGSITLAGDDLLIQTSRGELIIAPASEKAFKPLVRRQVVGRESRADAALVDGYYFVRDRQQLLGLDLRNRK